MSAQSNAPVIIKRVKKSGGDGHHGGAWKVAYADFVTAMMAFFLLMWLLNATTEKQRKGIADYFNPTIPINRVSGGGDGSFGGDSVFTEEELAQSGIGGLPTPPVDDSAGKAAQEAETEALKAVDEALTGRSGESMVSELAARHIVTRLSDEGLVIELFDIADDPLFAPKSTEPTPVLEELAGMMAQVFGLVENKLAVEGYVRAEPVVMSQSTVWSLSAGRADAVRRLLESAGYPDDRIARVTGHADHAPAADNPMAIRNNRIELVLLREKR